MRIDTTGIFFIPLKGFTYKASMQKILRMPDDSWFIEDGTDYISLRIKSM